jgi:hypothetical protein
MTTMRDLAFFETLLEAKQREHAAAQQAYADAQQRYAEAQRRVETLAVEVAQLEAAWLIVSEAVGAPEAPPEEDADLICRYKDVVAYGRRTAQGFLVRAKSQAGLHLQPSARAYVKPLRDKLQAEGSLVVSGDHLCFTEDVLFDTPTTAAVVIAGGAHVGGLESWRDAQGRTLKDLEAVQTGPRLVV